MVNKSFFPPDRAKRAAEAARKMPGNQAVTPAPIGHDTPVPPSPQ
jgi:hypothetical protein